MQRTDIPPAIARSRAADVARIPLAALKSMNPAELQFRLAAVDEFRRRRGRRGLDVDLARGYSDMAVEVLTTADPKHAARLMKAAGVASYTLRDGTKVPTGDEHELKAAIDVAKRDHRSGRPGDDPAFRQHLIARAKAVMPHVRGAIPASWAANAASKSAVSKAARIDQDPAMVRARQRLAEIQRRPGHAEPARPAAGTGYGRLVKASAPRPKDPPSVWRIGVGDRPAVAVHVPVLDSIASDSAKVIAKAANAGQLADLAREIGTIAKLTGSLAKADHYERQAAVMTVPADRSAYLELARREREKAGTA